MARIKARAQVRARATAAVLSQRDGQGTPRYQGTVYGGPEEKAGGPVNADPEPTGSLTGQILAQGRSDEAPPSRRKTARLVVALVGGLGILVTIGLLVIAGTQGIFSTIVDGLLAH